MRHYICNSSECHSNLYNDNDNDNEFLFRRMKRKKIVIHEINLQNKYAYIVKEITLIHNVAFFWMPCGNHLIFNVSYEVFSEIVRWPSQL